MAISHLENFHALSGIGLREPHINEVLNSPICTGWLEVHSENYFGDGNPLRTLSRLRENYAVSLHGVGLSLGSVDPLDQTHLYNLKYLVDRIQPWTVSDHLSWSSFRGRHFNDLLPLPYTEESLDHFCSKVNLVQDILQRQILIENPSTYMRFRHETIDEARFLEELCARTECGILLDINNVYVSAVNHEKDPIKFLDNIPSGYVKEIHLAGHTVKQEGKTRFLIDTHDQPIDEEVWALHEYYCAHNKRIPTLIERDSNIPPLHELLDEAGRAQANLEVAVDNVA